MLDAQSEWEIEGLITLLKHHDIKSILEVGARYGNTSRLLAEELNATKVIMVDLPGASGGRLNSEKVLHKNIQKMRKQGIKTEVILGDSRDQETVAKVAEYAPFDFVFIDGDHSYEATRDDWKHYGPMGRVVAFHDIAGDEKADKFQVGSFWNAAGQFGDCPTWEIIEYGRQMGIGVVFNGYH